MPITPVRVRARARGTSTCAFAPPGARREQQADHGGRDDRGGGADGEGQQRHRDQRGTEAAHRPGDGGEQEDDGTDAGDGEEFSHRRRRVRP
ncbi:hypothetical protein [Nocardioides sp. B-3]|uniref:hypothetical protein n=1 Tax=Nocardioides sp. B-3 TaxID=2895565 RepID=UPI0021531D63|nr:hypothetical protein [Nocardioides sp. B-3]UUZ59390.1 hypothetical protein LP418_26895 [Nocardioides sp. B-3]